MGGAAIGIDVGGTKIAGGVVDEHGRVITRQQVASPTGDADEIVTAILEVIGRLETDGKALPVGVGAAGLIDLDGQVRYAPNLAWRDVPLRVLLERSLGRAVAVENDGNAATWAEFLVGGAIDARKSAVMLTLGTGVGGGLVLEGRLLRGAHGLGAELGHLVIAEGGRPCNCGNLGCLEAYASGTAIGRLAVEWRERGDVPVGSPLDADGVGGPAVTQAAAEGDPTANAVLAEIGRWLGVGMASIANAVDPEIIVVGGGASAAGEPLLGPAREAMAARLMGAAYRQQPGVRRAELGADAGLVGAALLARPETAGVQPPQ